MTETLALTRCLFFFFLSGRQLGRYAASLSSIPKFTPCVDEGRGLLDDPGWPFLGSSDFVTPVSRSGPRVSKNQIVCWRDSSLDRGRSETFPNNDEEYSVRSNCSFWRGSPERVCTPPHCFFLCMVESLAASCSSEDLDVRFWLDISSVDWLIRGPSNHESIERPG